jgi:hypothetical protein
MTTAVLERPANKMGQNYANVSKRNDLKNRTQAVKRVDFEPFKTETEMVEFSELMIGEVWK